MGNKGVGRITDPPEDFPMPTYYLGICDGCKTIHTFGSKESRDHWEETHPCGGDDQ